MIPLEVPREDTQFAYLTEGLDISDRPALDGSRPKNPPRAVGSAGRNIPASREWSRSQPRVGDRWVATAGEHGVERWSIEPNTRDPEEPSVRHVPSHTLMQDHERAELKASLREMTDEVLGQRVSGRASMLGVAADEAMHDLGYYIAVGEPDERLIRMSTLIAQCAEGVFRARFAYRPCRLRIGEQTVSVPNDEHVSYATPVTWLNGFSAAAVSRNGRLLDRLCAIPGEPFEATRLDERGRMALPVVEALRTYWLGTSDLVSRLERAASRVTFLGGGWGEEIYLPAMDALVCLAANDVMGFNDAMYDALKRHRRMCLREGSVLFGSPRGMLAPILCGLMALAVDQGVEVTVTSGYLPPIFVEGVASVGQLSPGPRLGDIGGATDPESDSLFIESGQEDLIEVVNLRNEEDVVCCEYRILVPRLDPSTAERMIGFELLVRHTSDYYRPLSDRVRYTNLETGAVSIRPYP